MKRMLRWVVLLLAAASLSLLTSSHTAAKPVPSSPSPGVTVQAAVASPSKAFIGFCGHLQSHPETTLAEQSYATYPRIHRPFGGIRNLF
jgi:hypothetical protein